MYAVFFGAGFIFSNWAARIPQVRDGLHLSPANLGLLLLSIAAGSVIALPLAGLVVARLGAARTITVMAILAAGGLAIAAVGYRLGVAPVVVGLFLLGAGNGTWDVAMNVEGAYVEQRLERSIMPRFHAGFSIGMVTGALIGAGMVLAGVSVTVHLLLVAAVVAATVPWVVRWFLTVAAPASRGRAGRQPARGVEGAAHARARPARVLHGVHRGDGERLARRGRHRRLRRSAAVGSLTLGIFLGAMTTGRWFGPALLDRFGRVPDRARLGTPRVRRTAARRLRGSLPLAVAGAVLWGFGSALGFPVGMSAAADDSRHAAGRAQRGHLARLHRVPRGPAVRRPARQPRRHAPLPGRRRGACEHRRAHVRYPRSAPGGNAERDRLMPA